MRLLFLVLFFPVFSFSEDLSGTIWTLSGVGCRDASLDSDSHISKPIASADVSAGMFNFTDDRNVNMTAQVQGKEQSHRGTYTIHRDKVILRGGDGGITLYIRNQRLVIIGNRIESGTECCNVQWVDSWRTTKRDIEKEGRETWEQYKQRHNLDMDDDWTAETKEERKKLDNKCLKEKPFVYILGKVK